MHFFKSDTDFYKARENIFKNNFLAFRCCFTKLLLEKYFKFFFKFYVERFFQAKKIP